MEAGLRVGEGKGGKCQLSVSFVKIVNHLIPGRSTPFGGRFEAFAPENT